MESIRSSTFVMLFASWLRKSFLLIQAMNLYVGWFVPCFHALHVATGTHFFVLLGLASAARAFLVSLVACFREVGVEFWNSVMATIRSDFPWFASTLYHPVFGRVR